MTKSIMIHDALHPEIVRRPWKRRVVVGVIAGLAGVIAFVYWPLFIRVPDGADKIIVTNTHDEVVSQITEAQEIDQVVAFIRSKQLGWHTTWNTYPTSEYNVRFWREQHFRYVVWIGGAGSGWIGFRDGTNNTQKVLKEISATDRAKLLKLLHINESVKADP